MPRPVPGTYPSYFENYIKLVNASSAAEAIATYGKTVVEAFRNLPQVKADYSYAAGKWTLKEMLQHIIDTERIFAYRALCLARKETAMLPGFDENIYAANSQANKRKWDELLNEFEAVRHSTDLLLTSFNEEQLLAQGITNNNPTSVNALAFIVFGHILHHLNIIRERYLQAN